MMRGVIPKDRYITIKGFRLHYLDWGNEHQQPLMLLHGFMGHAHVWDNLALRLQSSYHVIALDQRGHGKSDWSKDKAYTLDDHFSDISLFMKKLSLENIILAGHSMGGRHALMYAACTPDHLDRLVLIDARPAHDRNSSQALRKLVTTLPLKARSLQEAVLAIRTLYLFLSEAISYHIAKYGYRRGSNGYYIPQYDTSMAEPSEHQGSKVEDLWPFLTAITCPVLIMRGTQSSFLSTEVSRQMCRHLPRAELKEIPASTHMPVQENPDVSYQVISDFLKS